MLIDLLIQSILNFPAPHPSVDTGFLPRSYVWHRMYLREFEKKAWKPKKTEEVTEKMNSACIHERGQGYWRNVYFRKMSGYSEDRWKLQLRRLDPYTGLSKDTVQVLRSAARPSCMSLFLFFFLYRYHKIQEAFCLPSCKDWRNCARYTMYSVVYASAPSYHVLQLSFETSPDIETHVNWGVIEGQPRGEARQGMCSFLSCPLRPSLTSLKC